LLRAAWKAQNMRCRPDMWQTSRHLIGMVIQPAHRSGGEAGSKIPHKH
jgi:hypothetical protein